MNSAAAIRREERFRRHMAAQGVELERPHIRFGFKWTKYRPDWYDPQADTYFEVIGTRQRGASIAPILDLMSLAYPRVDFRVVTPDGERVLPHRHGLHQRLRALPHGNAVALRAEAEAASLTDIALAIGVSPSHISAAARDGRASAWLAERLRAYAAHEAIPSDPLKKGVRRHECSQVCLDVLELYADGIGTPRIGALLGMYQASAHRILVVHGVSTRPVGYTRPAYEHVDA